MALAWPLVALAAVGAVTYLGRLVLLSRADAAAIRAELATKATLAEVEKLKERLTKVEGARAFGRVG